MATPFAKIKDAAAITGLSEHFLRKGCQNGTVPAIKSGTTYYIDVEKLLEQLHKEAEQPKQD
ncbi:MAG: helix-turn-helix domain-containing protein [Clostridiales bacterium]|nr:helix-turn-helix domain-containing protein [Clostridiales bacterium]